MNSFKSYLLFLFTLILTATLFFSCSDSDSKANSIPFPEEFHGTWVETGINNPDLGADTLIIDIDENTFEVRGYLDTDQEFAFKFVLIEQIEQNDDAGTFLLKNTEIVGESGKWGSGYGSEEIGYDFVDDENITITMPDGVGDILMTKTVFTQLEALKGTWEVGGEDNTLKFEGKTYTNEGTDNGNPFKYSGTWDASEDTIDSFDGIIRTVMTKEDGKSGLSYGSASPYELDGDNLKITYPGDPVTFKKK